MANIFEFGGQNFEANPVEKEIVHFLEIAAVELKIGTGENLDNAWGALEEAQRIADGNNEISDEILAHISFLSEKLILECQSRGLLSESVL